jgi:hypothetical protein
LLEEVLATINAMIAGDEVLSEERRALRFLGIGYVPPEAALSLPD